MSNYEVSHFHSESHFSSVPSAGVTTLCRSSAEDVFATKHVHTPATRLFLNVSSAIGCIVVSLLAWNHGYPAIAGVCWLVGGHFMHTIALSFHDAAHGTLHANRRVNEVLGYLFGTMILVPITAYRRAHARHHAQLASVDDPELYPFVIPGTSRLFRVSCAIAEIALGYVYTPILFFRSILTDKKLTRHDLHRILVEYAVIASMLVFVFISIELTGTWHIYALGVLPTLLIAGAYQTLNKYTEHLGLCGATILESTRSVLPRNCVNEAISSLLQHVDHHGTHHLHARIPYFELPQASEEVYRGKIGTLPVYHSYAAAFGAMLMTLPDPKVGPQWCTKSRGESLATSGHS